MMWYKSKISLSGILACALIVSGASSVHAITVGGSDFSNFADDADFLDPTLWATDTEASPTEDQLITAITGGSLSTAAFATNNADDAVPAFVDISFDNLVTNNVGDDLAIFDLGSADTYLVTINGIDLLVTSVEDLDLPNSNVVLLDLTDFGIADDASIISLRLLSNPVANTGSAADFSVIAGFTEIIDTGDNGDNGNNNAVPEPLTASLGVMAIAALGLGTRRRRIA